ncbi:hypothetical protein NF865_04970 [Thermococcus aggregans]|uniref:Uncharacterized protein n=1 Tax=Thermococcus aggregans TaxID=110163 RepID=A0A9E7MZ39_THEAG|nr:hypothetical protein [Thermococcus aggregans]USS41518.1 hypothetical protein NF865_04970 [Thermococcus aggregans]
MLAATYVNIKRIIVRPLLLAVIASGIAGSLLVAFSSSSIEHGTFAVFLGILLWGHKDLMFDKSNLMNKILALLSVLNFILFVLVLLSSAKF